MRWRSESTIVCIVGLRITYPLREDFSAVEKKVPQETRPIATTRLEKNDRFHGPINTASKDSSDQAALDTLLLCEAKGGLTENERREGDGGRRSVSAVANCSSKRAL